MRRYRPRGTPAVILRPAPRDAFGDRAAGTADQRIPVGFGAFAPGGSSEDLATRGDTVVSSGTIYLGPDITVRATDRIELEGRVWHVDGEPSPHRSGLTGTGGPTEVRVRAVSG